MRPRLLLAVRMINARLRHALVMGGLLLTATPLLSQSATTLDRFVGSWQEDESKAQFGAGGAIVFRRTDAGQLEELRGGQVNPQVQPVIFDGKPRTVDPNGRTIAWTQLNETAFRRVSSDKAGHLFLTRELEISPDARTLTEQNSWALAGSEGRKETIVYQREQGNAGLVGTWRMKSFKSSRPEVLKIERTGSSGLKFLWPFREVVDQITLTAQPVAATGPNVISGSMTSSKLLPDGSIEVTSMRNGNALSRVVYAVSTDGRTMTHTVTGLGKNATGKSSTYVFVKQPAAVPQQRSQADDGRRGEVLEAVRKSSEAQAACNTEIYEALHTPDFMFVQDGVQESMNRLRDGCVARKAPIRDDVQVRFYGDAAIVTSRLQQYRRDGTIAPAVRLTQVWVRQNGKWLNAHSHASDEKPAR